MVALTVHPRSVWLKIVAYRYNLVVQSCLSWRQSGVMIWARSNNNVFLRKESKPKGSEMVQKQLVKKSMCSHLTLTHHLSYQTTRRFPTLATLFSRRPLKESHLHASADRYRRDQLPESRSLAGWLVAWLVLYHSTAAHNTHHAASSDTSPLPVRFCLQHDMRVPSPSLLPAYHNLSPSKPSELFHYSIRCVCLLHRASHIISKWLLLFN